MKTYSIAFRYSKDGKGWTTTSTSVKAETEMGAIAQVQSKYPYVDNIRIMSVR